MCKRMTDIKLNYLYDIAVIGIIYLRQRMNKVT